MPEQNHSGGEVEGGDENVEPLGVLVALQLQPE